MTKIAIIGGGISGISLARIIGSKAEITVFEQKEKLGGLISCDIVKDYLYHKVGGHVFNSKNQEVLTWFWQFFNKETEFISAKRVAQIFIDGSHIGYPIEDNLYKLSKSTVDKVVTELLNIKKRKQAGGFGQFLRQNFGETLYQLYFKPYNEKIWNVNLDQVPLNWLEGKLPMPDVKNIIINNILRKEEDNMVHSYFYYPKNNGSQFIIDRLAEGVNYINNFHVETITVKKDGRIFINDIGPFNKVIFTGDVRTLPIILKNASISPGIVSSLNSIKSNGTTNILCSCEKNNLSWLYIPEKKYKAHRIIYTGNFSESNNGENLNSSCVVEFSNYISEEDAKNELKKLPGNLEFIAYNHQPNSYVIQGVDTKQIISNLKTELKAHQIFLLGRFSEWEYYNMDKAIEAAFALSYQLL